MFYQYARLLEDKGETDHDSVFIDGTKLESWANKYTFVWRGSIEKNLGKVREAVRQEIERRGIEGNVTIGKLHTLVVQETMRLKESGLELVSGRGHRKTPDQRAQEKLLELLTQWDGYKRSWRSWVSTATAIQRPILTRRSCT